jgi:type I restriction-modification system DNA methylase subunit
MSLAKNISKLNSIDKDSLNSAVIKIIDRIIFLRISEDKKVESYGALLNAAQSVNPYKNIKKIFEEADARYNSGLFESNQFINNLKIDDKILKDIIESLYYPDCIYEFSVLPVSILGNIYEQFLGKTIRQTETGLVKIEEKPEVRKAGGVYYTPEYIVDYIVQNTVGEKIKGLTPQEIEKIKILDPACGSGSFLIGAYQYLLDEHLDYYTKEEKNVKTALKNGNIIESSKDKTSYRLSIPQKQKILKNNIYGVDIDAQAVEVSKFSLLIKLMETETQDTMDELFQTSQIETQKGMKILPDLKNNIKCGNSLIGKDFLADNLMIDNEEVKRVNPFDWNDEFAEIMKGGGFDVVIGNPPYFNIQTLGVGSKQAEYIMYKYGDIWQDKSDILFYFIKKSIDISKTYVGMIVSNAFLFADKAQKLRNFILNYGNINKIINFEKHKVFDASIMTAVFVFEKNKQAGNTQALVLKESNYSDIRTLINCSDFITAKLEKNNVFALHDNKIALLNRKIDGSHHILRDIVLVGKGMETAANEVFLFEEYPQTFPNKYIKKRMSGEIISRYFIDKEKEWLLYFENTQNLNELPKIIHEHLLENRATLGKRATVKNEGRIWWRYSRPMHKEFYHLNKIWCSYRSKNNAFVLDESQDFIGLTNTTVIFDTNQNYKLKYILALLNSTLLNCRYKSIGKQTGGGVYEYFENGIGKLPIPEISIDEQKAFIDLVDMMMLIQKQLHLAKTESDKKIYQQKADIIDEQIDKLVYELYGLTEKEIKIVEGIK